MHWFPFYTKEWTASVAHMSAAQRGMYLSMLIYQWDNGTVPDCPDQCARIAGATSMGKSDWAVVRDKFHADQDRLVNHKLEDVRREQQDRHDNASRRGKRGASALHGRSKHGSSTGQALAQAQPKHGSSMAEACQSESESESESEERLAITVRPTRRTPVESPKPDNLTVLRSMAAADREGGREEFQ